MIYYQFYMIFIDIDAGGVQIQIIYLQSKKARSRRIINLVSSNYPSISFINLLHGNAKVLAWYISIIHCAFSPALTNEPLKNHEAKP